MPIDGLYAEQITSLANQQVKDAVKLRDRRQRKKRNQLLVEGYRESYRALHFGKVTPENFFFCPELFLGENEGELLGLAQEHGARLLETNKAVFQKLSYRDRPDGLLMVAPALERRLDSLDLPDHPMVIIAEQIEKPGNLGTILRTADAAGAHAVVVCDGVTDINNPNVVRASTGTLFTVPVAEASLSETLSWCEEHKLALVAATPHVETEYTSVDYRQGVALVLGAEQYGLSETMLKAARYPVRIPMNGFADSLNVAQAATILLFEAVRQRRKV